MRVHLQKEIGKLNRQILTLSTDVEEDVRAAVRSLEERDEALARSVIERENATNALEVDVEEECLKILALHQPVAADLRYIIAVLKINQDLERIADHATNIAEDLIYLVEGNIVRHKAVAAVAGSALLATMPADSG